jgi:hypothetical protein
MLQLGGGAVSKITRRPKLELHWLFVGRSGPFIPRRRSSEGNGLLTVLFCRNIALATAATASFVFGSWPSEALSRGWTQD